MQGLRQKGSSGKTIPARSVLGFVRERPCAQRSISADLIFWLLFYQEKSNSLRGNWAGWTLSSNKKYNFGATPPCKLLFWMPQFKPLNSSLFLFSVQRQFVAEPALGGGLQPRLHCDSYRPATIFTQHLFIFMLSLVIHCTAKYGREQAFRKSMMVNKFIPCYRAIKWWN